MRGKAPSDSCGPMKGTPQMVPLGSAETSLFSKKRLVRKGSGLSRDLTGSELWHFLCPWLVEP